MTASIQSRRFGILPSGEPVEAWQLMGSGGLLLECLTYGVIVTRLLVPDRNGLPADVVLGFDDLKGYLAGSACFGAIVGRVAGRIPTASFHIDGVTYRLTANDPPNHLHGGSRGFNQCLWHAEATTRPDSSPALRLTLISPDGDQGYPGAVKVTVTYTVTHDNAFLIETHATTDRTTPLSMTHHSYFNLGGESHGSIVDHDVQIHADACAAVNERMTLLGSMLPLVHPGNDLRHPQSLGDTIPHLFGGHGDLYRLSRPTHDHLAPAARLVHPPSGRALDVSTTEKYLQLYTASAFDGTIVGKSGRPYRKHAGVCLECQGYPDGVDRPHFGDILLHPGQTRYEATRYAFSTIPPLETSQP